MLFIDVPDLDVHHTGEDGGQLLLGGAADDGLLVQTVLHPQGRDQANKHRQDVGPDLEEYMLILSLDIRNPLYYRSKQDELCFTVCQI